MSQQATKKKDESIIFAGFITLVDIIKGTPITENLKNQKLYQECIFKNSSWR